MQADSASFSMYSAGYFQGVSSGTVALGAPKEFYEVGKLGNISPTLQLGKLRLRDGE